MLKAVIFDLDGTIVDAYTAVSRSVNHTLKAMGFAPRSYREIKRSVGGGDRKLLEHFVGPQLVERAVSIYRPDHAKALVSAGGVKLLPGSAGILKFLKDRGLKLAIASNRPTRFTRIILQQMKIRDYLDVVLCADHAPRPKPCPDILWAIAQRLKVRRSEALYVGDMTIDVDCGRRAGLRVVAVATGSSPRKELKDLKPWAVVDKIDRIKTLLGKDIHEQKIA